MAGTGLGGAGIEQKGKGKRTHGHGQQCGDCCMGGGRGRRGLNVKEKNIIKITLRNNKNENSKRYQYTHKNG